MPRDSKRAVAVNYSRGESMLRITVRNDESAEDAKMIKLKVESNKGEWFINKYCKGKPAEPQPFQLTRTQKKRMQRKRSIQRMKNMATNPDQAKFVNKGKVASPKAEVTQDIQW